MAGKPGRSGRVQGQPNKVTRDVREAIAVFAQANVDRMGEWLRQIEVDDPGKAMELYLRAIEYHIPKLSRAMVVGDPDQPVQHAVTHSVTAEAMDALRAKVTAGKAK